MLALFQPAPFGAWIAPDHEKVGSIHDATACPLHRDASRICARSHSLKAPESGTSRVLISPVVTVTERITAPSTATVNLTLTPDAVPASPKPTFVTSRRYLRSS